MVLVLLITHWAIGTPLGVMKCLQHNFTVCKECCVSPRGPAALREHRLGQHNRNMPLSWVLYTIPASENDMHIARNRILNQPTGPRYLP